MTFPATAASHLVRSDGFANMADVAVNSFFDPRLEEGCVFEELISFHSGLGGPQTEPFLLYPASFTLPPGQIIGAERNEMLRHWRAELQGYLPA